MEYREIPDEAIAQVAKHINDRSNKKYSIPIVGVYDNSETPHIFEIIPFEEIDKSESSFYAVDGSYNSQEFYNGLSLAVYSAGYICYHRGKQIRLNELDDPIILGKSYYPTTILLANTDDLYQVYDELINMEPINNFIYFCKETANNIFVYNREAVCQTVSSLLDFCQEILEWSMIFEILNLNATKKGDFILKDGTLRSLNVKQEFIVNLGRYAHSKGVYIVGITKKSPVKLELSYTLKQIDDYLQDELKPKYPFKEKTYRKQKLCCWFEVPMQVLYGAYRGVSGNMFIKKSLTGGRGFGIFHVARLDYVEKLQNYDWLISDLNIFDVMPEIDSEIRTTDLDTVEYIHSELTRLTQEHYILGYPYPLVDAHNFISLKRDFKEDVINRVKLNLYKDKRMDHIDIENLFIDSHDRF